MDLFSLSICIIGLYLKILLHYVLYQKMVMLHDYETYFITHTYIIYIYIEREIDGYIRFYYDIIQTHYYI